MYLQKLSAAWRCLCLCLLVSISGVAQTVSSGKSEKNLFRFSAGAVLGDPYTVVATAHRNDPAPAQKGPGTYTANPTHAPDLFPNVSATMIIGGQRLGVLIGLGYMPFTNSYTRQEEQENLGLATTSRTISTFSAQQKSNYMLLHTGISVSVVRHLSVDVDLQYALAVGTKRWISGTTVYQTTSPQQDTAGNWYWLVTKNSADFKDRKQLMRNNISDILLQLRVNYDLAWRKTFPVGIYAAYSRAFTYSVNWWGAGLYIYPFRKVRPKD